MKHSTDSSAVAAGKPIRRERTPNGEYVITNVPPKTYEGLLARVFDTDMFFFATTGMLPTQCNTYEVVKRTRPCSCRRPISTRVIFGCPIPVPDRKVSAQNLELKWETYPDAAYYKFSIYPEDAATTSPYVDERVDGTSFSIDKTLEKGTYRWRVDAYNSADRKLSERRRHQAYN